jgi:hypothetical protein
MAHEYPLTLKAKWAGKPTEKTPTTVSTGSGRITDGKSRREIEDSYGSVIAVFNQQYRLIDGACGLQWVLQKHDGKARSGAARWTGVRYLRTRTAVIALYRRLCAPGDDAIRQLLERLPDRHSRWGAKPTSINSTNG